MESSKTFVIEFTIPAASQWNTRLDEAQYKSYAMNVSEAIKQAVPNSTVALNKVPKMFAMSDIYCQLVQNFDDSNPYYEMVPRVYAFEVSFNGVLLFSKLLSRCWPNSQMVAKRAVDIAQAFDRGQDINQFQTTGTFAKAVPVRTKGSAGQGTVMSQPPQQQQMEASFQEPAQAQPSGKLEPMQFNSAEELEYHETFFPEGTKSLLSKHLTKEVWEEYKNQSDDAGVTFKTCVFSGIKNLDSGIGVYAGSHGSYTKFKKLFDPIIEEYHGHKPTDKHMSDMSSDLKNADFSPEDAAMINSTRIRVGRNLAGFPLGPGVSKEQRLEIMNLVVKACETFEGDLKGKFYPLEGMDKATQQQLIDDHFLFKEGDRFLAACNLNRDWPSGRGIFHNDAKTFLVWVNEEDQLRIISMQKGAGIKEVFDRLCRAAKHIETVCKFAHDDHNGYITSCPTNLGTAMRGSVHIKLPKLMNNKDQFNAIADKYYVQIRGIHGEHTETNDGVFDISNRRRLGRSEKELVQDMIDGVHALIEAEKKL